MLLAGAAGVGKSRLAETCVDLADAAHVPTARLAGHSEGRAIPFAAFAHLLPADVVAAGPDELDRAHVFHRARAALQEQAGDRRLLLAIDDADQLDDLSRALVTSLVQSRAVFAVMTMRTSNGVTPFDHLVKDGHLLRLDVAPLPQESIETLLHEVLGGPLVAGSLHRLAEAATGNPGVLRQLVETALDAGTLVEHDGVWRLSGPLRATASFEGLVAERLAGLDEAHHHAAELLAVAGEMALDALVPVAVGGVLEDLEQRGLLNVRPSGRRAGVSLAHPLFAEVLLRQLPELRARRLRRELAEAVEGVGARRRDDRVRLVAWRMDGGGDLAPDLVLHGARLALLEGDHVIAENLIRRAMADGGGVRAAELLAELYFRRNQPRQLEGVLAQLDLAVFSEPERVRLVRRRSSNLLYGLTDADSALRVLDEAAPLLAEPHTREALEAQRASILSMEGRIDEALACSEPLVGADSELVRFEVLRARSHAMAAAGRGDDALALVAEANVVHDGFADDLTRPGRSILLFSTLFAMAELGRINDARALGHVAGRGSAASGPWLAFARPRIELLAGNAGAALALSESYALEARAGGAFGAERWVLALVGMARLLAGDTEAGGRDVDRVAALWPQDVGLFRSDRDRARAWLAMARHDRMAAHDILQTGADSARRRGAYALEAMLLHDMVRFGWAPEVAGRLAVLATSMQGDLIQARALHAAGAAVADPTTLGRAVDGFERLGSPLFAAEAALQQADAARAQGARDGAAAATDRARRLRDRLDGPVFTALLDPAG